MHAALSYLAALPPQTVVYDGHEYTRGSLAFAKSVDPENAALARLEKLVKDGVIPAERTTIGDEKEWNPFMRLDSAPIQCAASAACRCVYSLFRVFTGKPLAVVSLVLLWTPCGK